MKCKLRKIVLILILIISATGYINIIESHAVNYNVISPSGATTLSANNKIIWENGIALEAEGQKRGLVYQYKAGPGFVAFGVISGTLLYEMVFPKSSMSALVQKASSGSIPAKMIDIGSSKTPRDIIGTPPNYRGKCTITSGGQLSGYNWTGCKRNGVYEYYNSQYWGPIFSYGGVAGQYGLEFLGTDIRNDINYVPAKSSFNATNVLSIIRSNFQFKPTLYTHKTSVFPVAGTDTIPSAGTSPLIIKKIIEPADVGGVSVVSDVLITGKYYVISKKVTAPAETPSPAGTQPPVTDPNAPPPPPDPNAPVPPPPIPPPAITTCTIYTASTDTFAKVFADLKIKMDATPVLATFGGFFNWSPSAVACPTWAIPLTLFGDSVAPVMVDFQCSAPFQSVMGIVKGVLLLVQCIF